MKILTIIDSLSIMVLWGSWTGVVQDGKKTIIGIVKQEFTTFVLGPLRIVKYD